MRLATIEHRGATAAAVVLDDAVAPIDGFADVGALLGAGDEGLGAAAAAAAAGRRQPLDRAALLSPVLAPGAIVCVGLNYRTHIVEMGRELPERPTLFAKLPRALTRPYAEIVLPAVSEQVDYEGELVLVIGRRGRDISIDEAPAHIAGFTVMNDVSMRDFQYRTIQWFAGKNFERSTPVGPWVVTADEVGSLDELELRVHVNGQLRQRALIGDLVFDPATLVADLSRIVTLEPGDLIATGTPGGVGYGLDPRRFLADGDVVEVEIDGVGALANVFVQPR